MIVWVRSFWHRIDMFQPLNDCSASVQLVAARSHSSTIVQFLIYDFVVDDVPVAQSVGYNAISITFGSYSSNAARFALSRMSTIYCKLGSNLFSLVCRALYAADFSNGGSMDSKNKDSGENKY